MDLGPVFPSLRRFLTRALLGFGISLAATAIAAADYLVVLDPGHGGRDGGALGSSGIAEKDVVLAFASQLRSVLADVPDIVVRLTREGDEALSLRARVEMAQKLKADLFISIHADSIREADIRGASVYTLAAKASDRIARALAESEARSDKLAGFPNVQSEPEVAGILLDLLRQETEVFSRSFADRIVMHLSRHTGLIGNPHRSANFRVLRAPDVPSVLVELGYLSNADDERLLTDPKWLDATARVLAEAIVGHARATGGLDATASR